MHRRRIDNHTAPVYVAVKRAYTRPDALPSVNDRDAKHFRRADAVTITLSRADVDAIRRALDDVDAPATLRRRFATN